VTNYAFYADSADVSLTDPLLRARLVTGVTTNPTILAKASKTIQDLAGLHARWTELGAAEVFFQSWGNSAAELLLHGRSLATLGPNIVVKVPATSIGFRTAGALVSDGTPVLMTAVYSVAQAIAANGIGARYIAPYLGRLFDSGRDGLAVIAEMRELLDGSDTQILAASLRSPEMITALAHRGVRRFTAAPDVLAAMFTHASSDAAALQFESDIAL
jgi:transaldolase